MRTIRTRKRTATLGAAVTAVLALALTACGGDDGSGTKSAGPASSAEATTTSKDSGQASDAAKSGGDTAKTDGSGSTGSASGSGSGSGTSKGGATKTGTSGGGNTSDDYAYKHPCQKGDLSVRVYPREGSPTQQVIEVNNTGSNSCGLSYYPRVSIGAQNATDHSGDIIPLVPGGLGGAPAYPVKPGTSAIAVLDFNPGGGNGLTWPDEMSVLPDGDNMSNAEQEGYPLPPGAKVGTAKLGLYQTSIADAVSSMESANTKP
ncbi:DUF4232 domain-containing protein [Streptomyces sp. NPDC057682]|uniref:DUF4232 domain-containing protein n=1 Tax=unclassified Streptomyces TaxID=2593676 RepID=UPI003652E76E